MTEVTTIVIVIRTVDPRRQAEALRAALGVTLRGARVAVVLEGPLQTAAARRSAATLAAFGHAVDADLEPALGHADVVEVWT